MSVFHNNILAGASGASGGAAAAFQIDRSLRFSSGDSAFLSRTPVNAGNRKTWTWSGWVKRSKLNNQARLFNADTDNSNRVELMLHNESDNYLRLELLGSSNSDLVTTQVFRDTSAWYHIVVAVDTTQSTNSDRVKIYVNGAQVTSFSTETYPSQNAKYAVNATSIHSIGRSFRYSRHFDGYMAEINFVDGQQLAATDFGEYDSSNVWQPKQFTGEYNVTTGTVYSSTSSGMSSPELMFDGDTSTSPSLTADGTVYTMLTGVSIACSSSLRINANANNFQVSVNGGSYTSATSVNSTYLSLSVPSGNTLTSLTFKDGAGGGYGVRALEVDGTVLVDGSVGKNGFHLNFSDNSTAASLGDDQREGVTDYPTGTTYGTIEGGSVSNVFDGVLGSSSELSLRPNGSGVTLDTAVTATSSVRIYGSSEGTASARYQINGSNTSAVPTTFPTRGWTTITGLTFPITINSFGIGGGSSTNGARLSAIEIDGDILTGTVNDWTATNFSIGSTAGIYAIFSGSSNQYLRYGASGVLSQNSSFTIECHFYPHTSNVIGLFDGGAGQTSIIRNYDNNKIEKQGGGSVDFAGDYTVNAWNHIAAVYNGSTDTMTVYVNGTSSGTASFSSFTGGNNFDIGTINGGGDGRFDGFIRNFRVTKSVVYSAAFTAPSVDNNLSALANTSLLVLTTVANGLTTDASGNSRNMTNNGSVTSGTHGGPHVNDSLIDTPTNYEADSGNNGGNYATLNPLDVNGSTTLSDGNLSCDKTGTSGYGLVKSSIAVSSGKWYCEYTLSGADQSVGITFASHGVGNNDYLQSVAGGIAYYSENGQAYTSSGGSAYGNTFGSGDVIGIALDLDNGKVFFSKNGTFQNSGNPVAGTNPAASSLSGTYVFGRHSGSQSNTTADGHWNFGQRPFAYTPPTGFKSLCTQNLPDPTIADPSTAFDVALWTGNGSARSISGFNFSPDFVWMKARTLGSARHGLFDTIRGATKRLVSHRTDGESTQSQTLTAFNSDGFDLGTDAAYNGNTYPVVGWAWDAGSSTVSNTNGSITSSVRANASAGFSIVSWNDSTQSAATIGHGLGKQPELIIAKTYDGSGNWWVFEPSLDTGGTISKALYLNDNTGKVTVSGIWGHWDEMTSTTFGITDSSGSGTNDGDMIAYCFTSVDQYSSFGTYEGNNSSDGPFVFTGMRPRWIMIKNADSTGAWAIYDTARDDVNAATKRLFPNLSSAESDATSNSLDILSNGFKIRSTGNVFNDNSTYIYAAFAEHPQKTARAR